MHVVPQLIVGVAFPGMDSAPHQKIALADAIAIRDRLARNARAEEGDRDWFFHAFDALAPSVRWRSTASSLSTRRDSAASAPG